MKSKSSIFLKTKTKNLYTNSKAKKLIKYYEIMKR